MVGLSSLGFVWLRSGLAICWAGRGILHCMESGWGGHDVTFLLVLS